MAVKTIKIKEGQTIFDVSLQLYGSIEYVYKIIADNPEITNLQYTALRGLTISYDEQKTSLTENFRTESITIVTAGTTTGTVLESEGLLADDGQQLLAGDGESLLGN